MRPGPFGLLAHPIKGIKSSSLQTTVNIVVCRLVCRLTIVQNFFSLLYVYFNEDLVPPHRMNYKGLTVPNPPFKEGLTQNTLNNDWNWRSVPDIKLVYVSPKRKVPFSGVFTIQSR